MIYTFGPFRLDVERRELYRDGVQLKVRPKVFDMLTVLIDQRDRVMSKDDLLAQLWPGRIVSETTLSSCIKELRKLLDDSGKQQKIIKTVHGRGFRFVAVLAAPSDATDAQPAAPEPQPAPAPVPPVLSPAGGEHKTVSALRCALVDADGVAEQLGAEALYYLLQDLFALSQDIIGRFDGQVTQWLSDGFLALFGVPAAVDDHARRALLAATELAQQSRGLRPERPPFVSFGVTSGSAIVSGVPGNPQQYHTALGSVMRLAETLCYHAPAGRVLISDASYRLLRADLRASPADQPQGGWLVEQVVTEQAGVPRRFRRPMAPLIGRDHELNLLRQRLAAAGERRGQAVAVVGTPGIGKSRLLEELRQTLTADRVRFLQGHCFAHTRGTPYFPLAEVLRRCCGVGDADPDDAVRDKLRTSLAAAGLGQEQALTLLLRLLDRPYDEASLAQLSAQAQRDHTAVCLQRLLLAGSLPTVLALEDLHWLDASSKAWLDSFVRQLANQPVLLVMTYRPGFSPDWLQLPWVSQLALAQLGREDCLRFLAALPRAAALRGHQEELARLSGGNPFFLGELALNAGGRRAGGHRQTVPDTVQGVLAARIDQLAPGDKQLLQTAAIIGQRGPLELLAAVSELAPDRLDDALLRLQYAELLFNDFGDGRQRFVFNHALVQEVAYASQLGDQRVAAHARVADTLRERFAELASRRPELLAHHYTEADRPQEAVRYWQRAGRKAYQRSAYVETAECVRAGLRLLDRLDAGRRAASELALQRTLGPALMSSHGYGAAEVEQTWTRARELCEQLQDHSALFRVLIGLSNCYWVTCKFEQAFDCNRQLLRLARQAGNTGFLLRATAAMGELMLHSGRLRSARRYIDQCMALIETDPEPAVSSAVAATCYAAWLYWLLGQNDLALRYGERALARARTLDRPFTTAIALCLIADLHRFRDDPPAALSLAQEGVELCARQGFPFWHGSTLVALGWAKARRGDPAQGIATIRHGIDVFCATGATVQLPSWLGALADAQRVAGRPQDALATVDEAAEWAKRTGDRYYLPQLLQLQKRLLERDVDRRPVTRQTAASRRRPGTDR